MEAYLDNSATTRCYPEVADILRKIMLEDYGNPSAKHQKGVDAERYVRGAQETIAKILRVEPKEIYFTSGGTESNNWALFGTAMANQRRGKHIITTAIEHAAIASPAAALEEMGFEVTRLPVSREGLVDPEEMVSRIRDDTILVSVMHVNNEIGAVEPVGQIGPMIKAKNPHTYFHVDAIQSFGKFRIYPKRMKIDMLSVSGHKLHGPKGTGFLYVRDGVKLKPIVFGGGQQNNMRSGTENVPGIAGLALASRMVYDDLDENVENMYRRKEQLAEGLSEIADVRIHGPLDLRNGAPHILDASFLGIRSEVLLHTLEERGIYVSAGSACSSHRRSGSATLAAVGCTPREMESAVRFSFSEQTTAEEIDYTLKVLEEVVPVLRRFTRK